MDRDELKAKAVEFYARWMKDPVNKGETWGTREVLADFALGMYEAGWKDGHEYEPPDDPEFNALLASAVEDINNKYRKEGYEAGQRAERERIADDIIQLHQNAKNTELFLRELSYFVHELKGGNATAHAMFDEMQEALGK